MCSLYFFLPFQHCFLIVCFLTADKICHSWASNCIYWFLSAAILLSWWWNEISVWFKPRLYPKFYRYPQHISSLHHQFRKHKIEINLSISSNIKIAVFNTPCIGKAWNSNKKLQLEVNLPNAMLLSAEWGATTVDDVIIYIMHQFGGTELLKI